MSERHEIGENWPGPTPPLCERCWSVIRPGEPVCRRTVECDGGVAIGFEHAHRSCIPQLPTRGGEAA